MKKYELEVETTKGKKETLVLAKEDLEGLRLEMKGEKRSVWEYKTKSGKILTDFDIEFIPDYVFEEVLEAERVFEELDNMMTEIENAGADLSYFPKGFDIMRKYAKKFILKKKGGEEL